LENEGIPIGVVEAIVGNGDLVVEVEGRTGHAGTTPISTRRDALIGASKIILGLREIIQQTGSSSVATVGSLAISPNASNVVPGRAVFTVDFRASTLDGMNFLQHEIASLATKVGREQDLKVSVTLKDIAQPAKMSMRVIHTVEASADSLGLSHRRVHSWAGHDCQNLAQITETGMIFVPSHEGLSHVPAEFTAPEQLEAGANVLLETLFRLANV
jgi:hydantoinase/carbamoylase family amidase